MPDTVEFLVLADFAKTLKGTSSQVTGADGTATKLSYYGAGQDSSPLLDFNFTLKSEYVDFTMGQWKSPISYEAGTSSAELIFPERSHAARYFGDNYDLGVKLEKKLKYVKYSLQLLQGNTANTIDNNKQKELALRLEFYPIDGLFVGGAGLASVGQRDTQRSTREVVEVDAGYDKDGVLLRGEMLWGKKGPSNDNVDRVSSRGMSVTAAYTIAKTIQPAFRFGLLDVDQELDPADLPLVAKFGFKTDTVRSYEFGLNYFIEGKNAKIMAAYGYLDFDSVPNVTFNPRHQVTLAAQFAY
ncbi:MAG: porin [Polyangiaceae bacterium]